jgi:hypothetical protein
LNFKTDDDVEAMERKMSELLGEIHKVLFEKLNKT